MREPPTPGPTSFEHAVRAVVAAIPPGEVLTYGEVAVEAGAPGAARAVGAVLARSDGDLPWWRVVTATGRLVPGQERAHARHLRAEGVRVAPATGRVELRRDPHPAATSNQRRSRSQGVRR